jgi:hypothetical protein
MLEMPMSEVLDSEVPDKVPLDHEAKAVLLGQASMLRAVYPLMLAHELGEWQAVSGRETIMRRLPALIGRLNSGPAKSASGA